MEEDLEFRCWNSKGFRTADILGNTRAYVLCECVSIETGWGLSQFCISLLSLIVAEGQRF